MLNTYSFLLVDDHPLFRKALIGVLEQEFNNISCDEAETISDMFDKVTLAMPDIILLDLNIPNSNGFDTLTRLKQMHPQIAVVVVSGQEDPATIYQVKQLGAAGFLPKSAMIDDMVTAIKHVIEGHLWFPECDAEQQEQSKLAKLTPRQHKILTLFAKGLLNKQIADELGVSEATVKAHATAIFLKLDVKTRTQAVIALQDSNAYSRSVFA